MTRKVSLLAGLLLAAVFVLASGSAQADPGDLDALFGQGGVAVSALSITQSGAAGTAVQPDGKIVVAGWCVVTQANSTLQSGFGLVRYNEDGSLDRSFGNDGVVYTPFSPGWAGGNALVLQPDGKIVVGGGVDGSDEQARFALARYNPDGSLDRSFGAGGIVITNIPDRSVGIASLVLQPDGKIVAAGGSGGIQTLGTGGAVFPLARYNPNGSLDTTFGNQGTVVTSIASSDWEAEVHALLIQPDGKLVALGDRNGHSFVVLRYRPNGVLDTSFGDAGTVTTPIDSIYGAAGAVLQPDGKIVAVGGTEATNPFEFAVVRYNQDGSLDKTFGQNGIVTTPIEASWAFATSVVRQPDGDLVVGGQSSNGRPEFVLARYQPDGSLDPSFGSGGIVITPARGSANQEEITGLALQADGQIVAAGESDYWAPDGSMKAHFIVARYQTSGALDGSFGQDGEVTTNLTGDDVAESALATPGGEIVAAGFTTTQDGPAFAVTAYGATGTETLHAPPTVFPGADSIAYAETLQSDGKIVAAGDSFNQNGHHIALARYLADGTLDMSFGNGGTVTTPIDTLDGARGVALEPDGKILVAGSGFESGTSFFLLARYNPDGSLDTSFGNAGSVRTRFAPDAVARALAVQPDGGIVVAGRSGGTIALARYRPNGSLDSTFGHGGELTGPSGAATSVALQPDGKIVVAGSVNDTFAVVRFETNGALDTSFGHAGEVLTTIGTSSGANGVSLQLNGKIVAAGWNKDSSGSGFVVARYLPDGSLDSAFGSTGVITTAIGVDAYGTGVAILPSGDIAVAGGSTASLDQDFTVARYFGDSDNLEVRKTGTGSGYVRSSIAGIACGSTCAARFADGTRITLTATPARGALVSWSGACASTFSCTLTLSSSQTIAVMFRACVVPGVKGQRLARAKRLIERSGCSVGRVRHRFSARTARGRIISQAPGAGTRLRVPHHEVGRVSGSVDLMV